MAENTSFVVIDLQKGVLADDGTWDPEGVVARTAELVERARASDVPVVWVQHNNPDEMPLGSDSWDFADGLKPAKDEARVDKQYGDSFEDTDFGAILDKLGVRHLVVAGAQTDACIRSTVHGALVRGYDVTLVSDCHTTGEFPAKYTGGEEISAKTKINMTNSYVQYGTDYPGRSGTTQTAAEVEF